MKSIPPLSIITAKSNVRSWTFECAITPGATKREAKDGSPKCLHEIVKTNLTFFSPTFGGSFYQSVNSGNIFKFKVNLSKKRNQRCTWILFATSLVTFFPNFPNREVQFQDKLLPLLTCTADTLFKFTWKSVLIHQSKWLFTSSTASALVPLGPNGRVLFTTNWLPQIWVLMGKWRETQFESVNVL